MARHRRPKGRIVHGILLLDKPLGLTSNEALQRVKNLFYARKAGHTGSLDPLASGMLPLCLGEATKVSAFLLDADKRYQVEGTLGVKTATGDAEGDVLEEREVPALTEQQMEQVLSVFRGKIKQIPPMYSALKHKGERLYKLARQGVEVEREAREVEIMDLQLTRLESPLFEIEVHCSKGTYIRTLVEDIGEALGCGAYVSALRRTSVGPFQDGMVTLDELEAMHAEDSRSLDSKLLKVEAALAAFPSVSLTADSAFYIQQGQAVLVPKAPTSGMVRLFQGEKQFLGMGEILDDGRVAPKRLIKTG